ncbi:MAG: hypothetical protein KGO96_12320 [Elusimicrobia bacterium]|nr:hypothetical protein [Elusimicrobiota bacterium]
MRLALIALAAIFATLALAQYLQHRANLAACRGNTTCTRAMDQETR